MPHILQPRTLQRIRGDAQRPTVRIPQDIAAGVPPEGIADVVERSPTFVFGPLKPDAAHQPEPLIEQLEIAA
jgi:hypothetical protein